MLCAFDGKDVALIISAAGTAIVAFLREVKRGNRNASKARKEKTTSGAPESNADQRPLPRILSIAILITNYLVIFAAIALLWVLFTAGEKEVLTVRIAAMIALSVVFVIISLDTNRGL